MKKICFTVVSAVCLLSACQSLLNPESGAIILEAEQKYLGKEMYYIGGGRCSETSDGISFNACRKTDTKYVVKNVSSFFDANTEKRVYFLEISRKREGLIKKRIFQVK